MMRRSVAVLSLTGAALAACDYPTELPRWDQTWQVAGEAVTVGVADLLPPEIGLNDAGTAFLTEVPGAGVSFSLADACPECAPLNGLVAPKPEFTATLNTTTTLPDELVSAALENGSFPVMLTHDFNFDPLVPSSAPDADRGYIAVTIRSDGNVVADTTISGEDHTFPEGSTLSPTLNVRPVAVTSDLAIEVRVYSPAGDPVEIDTSDELVATIGTSTLEISEITITAGSIAVEPTSQTLEFAGIEEDGVVVERIESGALLFQVENPFTLTGTLDLAFQLPGRTIERTLDLEEGEYTRRIEFTGEELRDILGSDEVELVASGTVGAAAGTITITPTQQLVLENDFELVLIMGGLEEEG